MKKYLIILFILPLTLVAPFAFAQVAPTEIPVSTQTSAMVTYANDSYAIYDPSGSVILGEAYNPGSSAGTYPFPTLIPPLGIDTGYTLLDTVGADWNTYCTMASLSSCESILTAVSSPWNAYNFDIIPDPVPFNINSSTLMNWQQILFVRTQELDQIWNSSTDSTSTVTQTYDPMNLYWVLLTGCITVFGACYCVFKWMYD